MSSTCTIKHRPSYSWVIMFLGHFVLSTSGLGYGRNLNHSGAEVPVIILCLRALTCARTTNFLLVLRGFFVASGCSRSSGLWLRFRLDLVALDGDKLPRTTRENPVIAHQLDLQSIRIRSTWITRVDGSYFRSIVLGPVAYKVPRRIVLLTPEYTETLQRLGAVTQHCAYRTYSKSLYIGSSATWMLHATGKGLTQIGVPLPSPAFTVQKRPGFPAYSGRS